MVSVEVVHIRTPTSFYFCSLVINGITGIIKNDYRQYLWLFWLFFSKMADDKTMNLCAVGPP
jgi:hypothetical protein